MADEMPDSALLVDLSCLLEGYEALDPSLDISTRQVETEELLPAQENKDRAKQDDKDYKKTQATQRRLKYRQKVKAERLSLRKQAEDLSAKVVDIQNEQAKRRAQRAGGLALSMWKAVASRQMERRCEAEEEQKRLRAAVIDRSRLINQMNAMLLTCQQADRTTTDRRVLNGQVGGEATLKTFVEELDAVYAQTDEVLREANFVVSSPLGYTVTWKHAEGLSFFESADATVFPFSFEKTRDAVASLVLSYTGNSYMFDIAGDSEDTSAVKYTADYQFEPGDSGKLAMFFATRRYREESRYVFACRALYEGQGEFEGFHSHETTWFVVRPLSDETSTRSSCTRMELYSRLVPVATNVSAEKSSRFTRLLSKTLEKKTHEMTRTLESLLLDRP